MRKLKILEVNKAYFPHIGGIETLVKQYSEELGQFDTQVRTLVCCDNRGGSIRERVNGVPVIRAANFGTYFSCPISTQFVKQFRRLSQKADVIHIHMPFPLADFAMLLSGFKGKVVLSWHSDIVKQKKLLTLYKPLLKYLLNRADMIFVATEGHIDGSDFLYEYREKCCILPYGLTVEDYLEIERKPILTEKLTDKDSVKVFFTGRLVYYKGVDVLLKAFRLVNGCELFIAGTGELEAELKAYAKEHNMEDKVHFLGFLPDGELKQAYADCDIFVLPSVAKSEAFGIVQLEAMVYGKPVINTLLPSGVPHVSIHKKTGLTVPPSDFESLSAAILALARNRELREEYGKNAADRVMENFNEKDIIRKLYEYLSEGIDR